MKRKGLAILALANGAALSSGTAAFAKPTDVSISGAGSSLVAPLVQQWISPLGSAYGFSLTCASVGSGTGIGQITAHSRFSVPRTPR